MATKNSSLETPNCPVFLCTLVESGRRVLVDAVDSFTATEFVEIMCGKVSKTVRVAKCMLEARMVPFDLDIR